MNYILFRNIDEYSQFPSEQCKYDNLILLRKLRIYDKYLYAVQYEQHYTIKIVFITRVYNTIGAPVIILMCYDVLKTPFVKLYILKVRTTPSMCNIHIKDSIS